MTLFVSATQAQNRTDSGKLLPDPLSFIKKNYKWNSEKFLVITFRQSRSKCHYDNYKVIRNSTAIRRGFKNLTDNTKDFDTKIITVSSDKKKVEKYVDNETSFYDLYDFLGFRFFSKNKSCYGLIVINQSGQFISQVGEYSIKNINSFLAQLDK